MRRIVAFAFVAIALSGCGKSGGQSSPVTPAGNLPNGAVIKGQAILTLSTGQPLLQAMTVAPSQTVPVNTTVAAWTKFALDTTGFSVPSTPTPFAVDDFGTLKIKTLQDNDLNVCGKNGHSHCSSAMIRIYTEGTPGAGLWNSADAYGAPILATPAGVSSASNVGLNVAGAAVLQQISIAPNKHVVTLDDFPNANYDIQVDFTNAGAGAYSTQLVLEYALAP